jgi:hypothetical protein
LLHILQMVHHHASSAAGFASFHTSAACINAGLIFRILHTTISYFLILDWLMLLVNE